MHTEVLDKDWQEIFSQLKSFKNFYLAGGTALALQLGHRISIDFDLFSDKPISRELLQNVKKVFSGKTVMLSVNNADEFTVFVENVKVTFLRYPFPILQNFVGFKGIKLLNIQEIAATKAYTIGRRGNLKDYVDLYFLLFEKHISLNRLIILAEKKFMSHFNARLFLEQLIYLEDIEDIPIFFLKKPVSKKELQRFFEKAVRKIKL